MPRRICLTCGAPFTPRGRDTRCAAHQRENRKAEGTAWVRLRNAVLERDGYICRYCGGRANTADHIVPVSRGGVEAEGNLVAACVRCNSAKGTMTLTEFMDSKWMRENRAGVIRTPES